MLAQENNAALLAASHIGAQVQFREVDIAGPAHAEHARVTKVEGDQADKGVAVKEVKLQSARNVPQQQTGRDSKRKNAKVDPARGHEGTHACLRRAAYASNPMGQPEEMGKLNSSRSEEDRNSRCSLKNLREATGGRIPSLKR